MARNSVMYLSACGLFVSAGILIGMILATKTPDSVDWVKYYDTLIAGSLAVFAAGLAVFASLYVDENQSRRYFRWDALVAYRAADPGVKDLLQWASDIEGHRLAATSGIASQDLTSETEMKVVEAAQFMSSKVLQLHQLIGSRSISEAKRMLSPNAIRSVELLESRQLSLQPSF